MNKSELTEIIRKLVAEEVKNQFPSLISEILGRPSKPIVQETRQPKLTIPKTGNAALDRVLQQTVPNIKRQPGPPVSLDGEFKMNASFELPATDYDSSEMMNEGVDMMEPVELPDFMNKNFSNVLKSSIKASAMRNGVNGPL